MLPQPPEDGVTAQEITRQASLRALGRRPRLRRLAIILWSGFLGGVVLLLAWLALAPDELLGPQTLGQLTLMFLVGWAISLVPALAAALLIAPTDDLAAAGCRPTSLSRAAGEGGTARGAGGGVRTGRPAPGGEPDDGR
ncbi:MAG: hypothetical protein HYZ32_01840 [Hydrocarboniphaga effusa]|nr:hypothetical protein [Hydrocarboniphaga effusa]